MTHVVEAANCVNSSTGQALSERIIEILKSDLSDGAKLAAIAILTTGAKTARDIATATKNKLRTVERHYAELRSSGTQICGVDHADLRSPEPSRVRARIESSLREDTPTLDKRESVDRESTTTTVETRGEQHSTSEILKKCQPVITQLARALYHDCPFPDRAGIEKFIRAALDSGSHVEDVLEAARILLGKAIEEDEITRPAALFMRILGDVKRDGRRGKPTIPLGAIDLGNGQYLSRW